MKRTFSIIMMYLAFSLMQGTYSSAYAESDNHYYQTVSLPKVNLNSDQGERIETIKFVMHCGRFSALNYIPNDWSAEVVSPVSEETTLSMSAGHGSSSLWGTDDLTEFITVLVYEPTCFNITALVTASNYIGNNKQERKIDFSQKELIIKRLPNKKLHRTPNSGRL
jgi:hypothetical protein